jgi:glutaredoxin
MINPMLRLSRSFQPLIAISIAIGSMIIGTSVRANPLPIDSALNSPAATPLLIAESVSQPRRYGSGRALLYKHIDTISGDAETALVEHLTKHGVKFYGAYWCQHCFMQKTLFGETAAAQLPYVECAEGADNSQPEICKQQNVSRFPTWEVNGKLLVGVRDLQDIAAMTGYTGPTNFKYNRR